MSERGNIVITASKIQGSIRLYAGFGQSWISETHMSNSKLEIVIQEGSSQNKAPGALYIAVQGVESSSFTLKVSQDACNPQTTCNGHGTCENGACRCSNDWTGLDCSSPSCPSGCSNRGMCEVVNGRPTCKCSTGKFE